MRPLLTRTEVANILKVHPRTVHRLEQQGRLPSIVLSGTLVRYREEDVATLVDEYFCKRRR